MTEQEFKDRTRAVGLRVIRLVEASPKTRTGDAGIVTEKKLSSLMKEIDEIIAMTVASIQTLRSRNPKSKIQNPKSKIEE